MSAGLRSLVLFGSGPGLGRSIAAKFAKEGFEHVILLSRNQARLEEDKRAVLVGHGNNIHVDIVTVDLANATSLQTAFEQIDRLTHNIEAVVFNAARVAPSTLLETSPEVIEEDFKTTNIGLYLVAQWVVPKLQVLAKDHLTAKPSLIVTSGLLHREPEPSVFSLSMTKTSQRNLVQCLNKVYQKDGIHVGLVLVGGVVGPEQKVLNPTHIADVTWDFFFQAKEEWSLEITVQGD